MDLGCSLVREHWRAIHREPVAGAIQTDVDGSRAPRLFVLEQGRPAMKHLVAGLALSMAVFAGISFAALRGERATSISRTPMRTSFPSLLSSGWGFGFGFGSQQSPTIFSQLPDTPAAVKFREQFEVRKTGDYDALRRFYSENLDAATEDAIVGNAATDVDMFRRFGPSDIVAFEVLESTPFRLVLLVQERGAAPLASWVRREIEVTPDGSHKIVRQMYVSFGPQKPSLDATEIPPPPGFQIADRKPPDAAFPPGEAPWEKPFPVATSVLRSYVGTYDFDPPGNSALVTYRDEQLYAQVLGQEEVRMFPKTDTRFYAQGRVMRWIEFTKNENGQVTGLVLNSSGFELTGRRRK
jgi:hypothetical protein